MKIRASTFILAAALVSAAAAPSTAAPFDAVAAKARIGSLVDQSYPHLFDVYRDIHSHPELGFHETRTEAILAKEIRAIGFEVTQHFGGATGLVAIYRNGPGPVVLVRTELDALPMEEKTGLPYASRQQEPASDYTAPGQPVDPATVGKMTFVDHSCGHDIHMAWWLATAKALVALKDEWHGTLMFVGEPAEEIGGGATAMLKAGLFTKFPKPDYGFAAHINPGVAGSVVMKGGPVTSNSDTFHIVFKGRGGHGSIPQATIDPIVEGARFVMDVQTIVSREKAPDRQGVISVGSFQAGSTANIIPDQADIRLTMRSGDPETRAKLLDGMGRTARAVAAMSNAPEPDFQRIGFGATAVMNDAALIERERANLAAAFGDRFEDVPAAVPGRAGAETYAEFIEAGVPSIFFGVGGTDPALIASSKAKGVPVPVNHSPQFAPVPDVSIKTGAELLTLAVLTVAHTGQ